MQVLWYSAISIIVFQFKNTTIISFPILSSQWGSHTFLVSYLPSVRSLGYLWNELTVVPPQILEILVPSIEQQPLILIQTSAFLLPFQKSIPWELLWTCVLLYLIDTTSFPNSWYISFIVSHFSFWTWSNYMSILVIVFMFWKLLVHILESKISSMRQMFKRAK